MATDRALGGKDADMAGTGKIAHDLGRGADHTQHATCRVNQGKVVLLNGAQRLGRSCVAAQDD